VGKAAISSVTILQSGTPGEEESIRFVVPLTSERASTHRVLLRHQMPVKKKEIPELLEMIRTG